MTEYGTMINNQLIKHQEYHDGDKTLTYTEAPQQDGYVAVFKWTERTDDIVQEWWLVKDDSEPDPYADELPDTEALNIILGETP